MTEIAAELVEDTIAWQDAVGLSDAIGKELIRRQIPGVHEALVMPGVAITTDYVAGAGEGFSYVRLGNAYQVLQFPIPQATYQAGAPLQITRSFELGILRGVALPEDGNALTRDEWFDVTRLAMADMQALLAVICSYFGSRGIPFLVGSYQPAGPEGGVVGGSWTVQAGQPL